MDLTPKLDPEAPKLEVLPYLGLAPGWRFLLAPGHVDVWFDPATLEES